MHKEILSEILVFKTNISQADVERVTPVLASDYRVKKWNIDLEDIDRVLRIECTEQCAGDVIQLIHKAGFHCEELPD